MADSDKAGVSILATIRVQRTMMRLSETGLACWLGMRKLLFALALGTTATALFVSTHAWAPTLKWVLVMFLVWGFYEHVVRQHRFGSSIILLTTRGILMSSDDRYLDWEDISTWKANTRLLSFEVDTPGTLNGLFARRSFEIPLTPDYRNLVIEEFQRRVDGRIRN